MAIITEEQDSSNSTPMKPTKKPKIDPSSSTNPNPFAFWFYFTISVTLLTLIFVTISSLSIPQDPKSRFLELPRNLRQHYSNGRTIKVQATPHSASIEVFAIQDGPVGSSHDVLIVHGLGCSSYIFSETVKSLAKKGVHAVALDLPGSGFSDKSETVTEEKVVGGFGRLREMYNEIKEKGLFWGFDQLIEQGYVKYDHEENEIRVSKVDSLKPIELGPDEMGRVLGQVINTMGLAPVDLVLHDSAFNLAANWVSENPKSVSSVTLVDTSSNQTAFPLWVLKFPVVREVVLGFDLVFRKVIHSCCSKSVGRSDTETHRLLLKSGNGRKSVVGMGMKMNSSFDAAEWGRRDGMKDLPMQVIWSGWWSKEWSKEGQQVASMLPQAAFATHSSSRWPQEDTADELAESIYGFVSRLQKPIKPAEKKEPIPDHFQEMLDEATANVHHHGFRGKEVGYPSAYGLGHEFS